MSYLLPFAFVKHKYKITANTDRDRMALLYRDLIDIVKLLLRGVAIDEEWYLAQYPDVAEAIEGGMFKSGQASLRRKRLFRRPPVGAIRGGRGVVPDNLSRCRRWHRGR